MATPILSGHAYAFGLGARFGDPYQAAIRSQGFALPDAYRAGQFAALGWWPVVVYAAAAAPVAAPEPGARFVVVAFRAGSSTTLATWPWGSVMALPDVRWVLDLSPGVVAGGEARH
jgi:hypothetical protein